MHFGRFPRKTLLAATLFLAFSSANASFVEQVGAPAAPLPVMGTYAADAAIKPGLKAVIPAGWQLFHHQSVELPATLSWDKDDTWVAVLNKFASKQDIAVLIDWDKKQVFFRSTALALQEQEKRQMISQAASTPLPAFKAPEPKLAASAPTAKPVDASVPNQPVGAAVTASAVVPTFGAVTLGSANSSRALVAASAVSASASSPSVAPTSTAPMPAVAAAVATSASAVVVAASAPTPVSLPVTAPAVATVAPALAAASVSPAPVVATATFPPSAPAAPKHSVRPPVKTSPVTLAAASPAAADPKITTAVLPASIPSQGASAQMVTAAASPARVTVVSASQPVASAALVASAPVLPAPAASPVVSVVAAALPMEAPAAIPVSAAATAPVPVPAEAPGAVSFNREPVSTVVAAAGAKYGYTVSWEASQVVFPGPVTLLGADMGEDMNLVLRALGGRRSPVGITVYRESNVVVVRDVASGSASVAFADVPFSGQIREIVGAKPRAAVFAAAQTATPAMLVKAAPVAVVTAPAAVLPSLPAASLPVMARPAPARAVIATTVPAPLAPAAPARVTPEPVIQDTAVATIKKLEPAQPLVAATGTVVTLRIPAGGQLRDAIEAILEPGWSLNWDVKDELQANSEMTASGESLKATLNQVLPQLNLSFDIYKPSKKLVVREANPALDK